jgi:uncharacterized membrane protein YjjP (DUF1212 family)
MPDRLENQPVEQDAATDVRDPRIAFAVKLGTALHRYGASTHRLEQAMNLILRRLGVGGHFFSMPTGVFASFGLPEEHRTSLIRVQPSEVDLGKLTLLDELVSLVIAQKIGANEGSRRVDEIIASPSRYGLLLTTVCFGLTSGAASRFFGGGWREAVVSTAIGLVLGALSRAMGRSEDKRRVFEPVASLMAAALAVVTAQFVFPLSIYVTTLAGLIVLVPGLTLTTAMTELATRDLVSGTARLMGAVLIFLEIGFGVALGWQVTRLAPSPLVLAPSPLPAWTLVIAMVISPLALAVLLRAEPRDIGWILLAGVIGIGGFRAGAYILGPELGSFLGALLVGAGSTLYARSFNRPAAIPQVPGIMLLVPGSIGFGSLSRFIERDVVSAVETAFSMGLVAVALVTGLLLANLIVPPRKAL